VIIKSNQVPPYNETLFKLARLHDAYHINCRNVGTATQPNWGEYGYKPNIPLSQTILCSMTAPAPNTTKTPYLQGPVVPNIVGPN
jgi:hypothetical protein